MKEYYIHDNEGYDHMSPKGNRHAANLLLPALHDWLQMLPHAVRVGGAP
jgi:hypothetical protein